MRRIHFFIFICLLGMHFTSLAQDEDFFQDKASTKRNLLGVNFTQLFLREIQLSYERFITDKFSMEGGLGYKYSSARDLYDAFDKAPLSTTLMDYEKNGGYMPFIPFSKGYFASVTPKLNFNKNFYLGLNGFYRNYSFDNKYIIFPEDGDDPRIVLRSERQETLGLKLLFGVRAFAPDDIPIYCDVFAGHGFRQRTRWVEDKGLAIDSESINDIKMYDSPIESKQIKYFFTPHFGIKFGYIF